MKVYIVFTSDNSYMRVFENKQTATDCVKWFNSDADYYITAAMCGIEVEKTFIMPIPEVEECEQKDPTDTYNPEC